MRIDEICSCSIHIICLIVKSSCLVVVLLYIDQFLLMAVRVLTGSATARTVLYGQWCMRCDVTTRNRAGRSGKTNSSLRTRYIVAGVISFRHCHRHRRLTCIVNIATFDFVRPSVGQEAYSLHARLQSQLTPPRDWRLSHPF
jgi:hypothetical protein